MRRQIREIRIIDLFTYYFLPLPVTGAVWLLYAFVLSDLRKWIAVSCLVISIIVSYLALKRFLIGAVLMYKAFAPMELRCQCRFEPTCSTYMILALKKYGLIIGLFKGILRIIRCRPPNGGVDYP